MRAILYVLKAVKWWLIVPGAILLACVALGLMSWGWALGIGVGLLVLVFTASVALATMSGG